MRHTRAFSFHRGDYAGPRAWNFVCDGHLRDERPDRPTGAIAAYAGGNRMNAAPYRYAASALLLIALLASTWWHGWHTRDQQAERAAQDKALADARQALTDFHTESNRLNTIAGDIRQRVDQINANAARHSTEYRTYVTQNPLPADCRRDS